VLHIGSTAGAPWWDMWDPRVIQRMDDVAREHILPWRDDPRPIGCDEPTQGRFDGENFNFGLVDIHDRPYETVTHERSELAQSPRRLTENAPYRLQLHVAVTSSGRDHAALSELGYVRQRLPPAREVVYTHQHPLGRPSVNVRPPAGRRSVVGR